MNLSVSSLFAGLIFSSVGIMAFRRGKDRSNPRLMAIGAVLFVYSYLTSSPLADWGIGIVLSGATYYYWRA